MKKLISLLYNISLHLVFLFFLPKIVKRLFVRKLSKKIFSRLGIGFKCVLRDSDNSPLVWVHGASVGEIKLTLPLIKKLKQEYPHYRFLFTASSQYGVEIAGEIKEADYVFFLPLDLYYIITPIVKKLRPRLLICSEGDLWFNFFSAIKRFGGKIIIINGKMSSSSVKKFLKVGFFSKRLLSFVDFFCLQNENLKEHFLNLKVKEKNMKVLGDIKITIMPKNYSEEEKSSLRNLLKVSLKDQIFVLGSTHDPEEIIFLKAFKKLNFLDQNIKIILVPRHPFRIPSIEKLLKNNGVSYCLWSSIVSQKHGDIILVDCVGLLCYFYSIASFAFVGGTFVKEIGGHNLVEPLFYNVPVMFGPHVFSQKNAYYILKKFNCGIETSEEFLVNDLRRLFSDFSYRRSLILNIQPFLKNNSESFEETLSAIKSLI